MREIFEDTVELNFPVMGSEMHTDHSYDLYSAISHEIEEAHSSDWIGIHSFRGLKIRPGVIRLASPEALRVRISLDRVPYVYKLSGKSLRVGRFRVRCGIPTVALLEPSEFLRARIVVIKSAHHDRVEPESFLRSLNRQIEALGVTCKAQIERKSERGNPDCGLARRIVSVKTNTIVGYGVLLSELSEVDSIKIQTAGIGGRRRMGCGLFEPVESVIFQD